jgi:hypothetical protein
MEKRLLISVRRRWSSVNPRRLAVNRLSLRDRSQDLVSQARVLRRRLDSPHCPRGPLEYRDSPLDESSN